MKSPEMGIRGIFALATFLGTTGFAKPSPEAPEVQGVYFTAATDVFQDQNQNGIYDKGDYPLPNFGVQLLHNGQLINAGYTDFFGDVRFPVPWDGKSQLDGQGYALVFGQQAGAPACEFTGEIKDGILLAPSLPIKNKEGHKVGKTWQVAVNCDSDVFPNPPTPIVDSVHLCDDVAGDGVCDPTDPPLAGREVPVFDGMDIVNVGVGNLPPDQFRPVDSGVTDESGKTTVTTQTGNVSFDDPFDVECVVVQTIITQSPGQRDVSLALHCD